MAVYIEKLEDDPATTMHNITSDKDKKNYKINGEM